MKKTKIIILFSILLVAFLANCTTSSPKSNLDMKLEQNLVIGEPLGDNDQNFLSFQAVETDTTGNIYLLNEKKLMKFDKNGKKTWTVDKKGQGPGEFLRIVDLALTNQDHLVVVDQDGRKILMFTLEGQFIDEFKIRNGLPVKVDVDSEEYIYVAIQGGTSENILHKFRKDGTLIHSFLEKKFLDEKKAMLRDAKNRVNFCIGYNDNIYVSYQYDYKVVVFDTDGKELREWTRELPFKPKKMKILQPQPNWLQLDADILIRDIAVDSNNNVYALWGCKPSDKGYLIDKFTADGKLLGNFYSHVKPDPDYSMIQLFQVDRSNNLYILHWSEQPKVYRFKMICE